jgi:hypothetical protein
MAHWEMNSMKKRLSLEEGINQMVGDIPRPLYLTIKSRSYVENRIKIGIGCNSTIVLGGIYGMSNKSNNRKADAIAVS